MQKPQDHQGTTDGELRHLAVGRHFTACFDEGRVTTERIGDVTCPRCREAHAKGRPAADAWIARMYERLVANGHAPDFEGTAAREPERG